jgi:hypothetical protein
MFIFRYDYFTLAAHIQGCNWGAGGELLRGFDAWVNFRLLGEPGSLHWASAIHKIAHPAAEQGTTQDSPDPAINLLFDLLLEFSQPDAGG